MAHIVVAYDASDASRKGLEKAVAMLIEGDEIILVSILPDAKIAGMEQMEGGEKIGDLREQANAALAELRKKGVNAVAIIKEGDVVNEILAVADETECSVIVVGGGGVSKVGRFALGSVAEGVSKRSKRPVMIVK